ncbi:hypothetical protein NLJ89_g11511 [Agrocybe chaxingu]|uniref:Retrotransposon gag domain-containing protein n=1 Tax=Agrocybe chaxingu TaxID=84603 RepID=A0A9W8JP89_9AGAR|nr:hypothetical protein NLJ89_g11511 [Agrocybe chaxingu]
MQRKAALWITGAFRTSPTGALEALAGLIPVHLMLKKLAARAVYRVATLSDTHPLRSMLSSAYVKNVEPHPRSSSSMTLSMQAAVCLAIRQADCCHVMVFTDSLGSAQRAVDPSVHSGQAHSLSICRTLSEWFAADDFHHITFIFVPSSLCWDIHGAVHDFTLALIVLGNFKLASPRSPFVDNALPALYQNHPGPFWTTWLSLATLFWEIALLDRNTRFTRRSAVRSNLPVLGPLHQAGRARSVDSIRDTSGPSSSSTPSSPPIQVTPLSTIPSGNPIHQNPPPPRTITTMTGISKIDLPSLSAPLTAVSVLAWLGLCEDSFEAWGYLNPSHTLEVKVQILTAGLKMEASAAAQWWSDNRVELKALTTWEKFAERVRDRFIPSNWKLHALKDFYSLSQGSGSFSDFAARLQAARNTLGSAGKGFTINDSIFKNHLLFHSHNLLCLRISRTFGTPSTPVIPFLQPLSQEEREKLRAVNGCFHCRKSPSSPGWISHDARNCPGDKAKGISPRFTINGKTVVGAILASNEEVPPGHTLICPPFPGDVNVCYSVPEEDVVAAVIPSCVLEGDDSSDYDDE